MQIHPGQTWGKRQSNGNVTVYLVLKIDRKNRLLLQNLKTPTSVFETDANKLEQNGYFRVSETPYIDLKSKHRKHTHKVKLVRCPRTVDLFEGRADSEFPAIRPD